jgi:hypothetical protein
MNNKIGSHEPARPLARLNTDALHDGNSERVDLNANGSAEVPSLNELGEWVMALAERCGGNVAAMARKIACLRAARGGTSDTSQTALTCLRHPRIKAVTLANEHRSILKHLADAQEELQPLLVATISKVLEIDLYTADLLRWEEAQARKKAADALHKESGILPEARASVAMLARLGILEGHWSTMTRATAEKVAALLLADNAAAGFGSPDDPQISGPRSRRAR